MALPVHAQRVVPTMKNTPMEGQPENYLISDAGSTSVWRTALLEKVSAPRESRSSLAISTRSPLGHELRGLESHLSWGYVVGGCEELLRRLCRVGPAASLRVPDLEAVEMKPRQAPVLTAKQTHWVVGRDNCAAAIAHVPEARTAPPQFDRVRSWKETAFDPMSNELPDDIRNHDGSVTTPATPD
jgi:hypothetical protein